MSVGEWGGTIFYKIIRGPENRERNTLKDEENKTEVTLAGTKKPESQPIHWRKILMREERKEQPRESRMIKYRETIMKKAGSAREQKRNVVSKHKGENIKKKGWGGTSNAETKQERAKHLKAGEE